MLIGANNINDKTHQMQHYNLQCISVSGVDLALLSLADHHIITFGTFGMWGSLLGSTDGITICPKDYAKTDVGREVKSANLNNWLFL